MHKFFVSDEERSQTEDNAKRFINDKCIWRKGAHELPLEGKRPGTRYTWMFMLRNGLFYHPFLTDISLLLLDKMQTEIGHFDFQLAGAESAATPLISAIPLVASSFGIDINSFSVRKEQKTYGLKNWIEGRPNDKPVVLVDDLCNSSISLCHAYRICQAHGLIPKQAFVIVNKVNKGYHDPLRQTSDFHLPSDFKVSSLYDLDSFNLYGAH